MDKFMKKIWLNKNITKYLLWKISRIYIFLLLALLIIFVIMNNPPILYQFQYHVILHNHKITYNDQLFFPFGFYYVDYDSSPKKLLKGQMQALENIAKAGFNVLHISMNDNLSDHKFLLSRAKDLNMSIIQADFNLIESMGFIKSSPALLAWSIGDDINRNYKPEEILKLHNQVKSYDHNHSTYVSMFDSDPQVIEQYMHVADWVGMQSYPVANRSLDSTFYEIKSAVETSLQTQGSPIIANLQTFQWEKQRSPTPVEVRNMTYQALIAGARGIIYYTYRDSTWYLPEHSDLWEGIKSLVPEIKTLSPILIHGKLQQINTELSNILAGVWKYKNQYVVIVINTDEFQSKQVSIKLSNGITYAKPMFENRPLGMVINSGKLSGLVKAKEVQIYSFKD
jgi:hypothetical protein